MEVLQVAEFRTPASFHVQEVSHDSGLTPSWVAKSSPTGLAAPMPTTRAVTSMTICGVPPTLMLCCKSERPPFPTSHKLGVKTLESPPTFDGAPSREYGREVQMRSWIAQCRCPRNSGADYVSRCSPLAHRSQIDVQMAWKRRGRVYGENQTKWIVKIKQVTADGRKPERMEVLAEVLSIRSRVTRRTSGGGGGVSKRGLDPRMGA